MTKLTKDDMHLMRATLSNIENVDEDPYYILIHADKYINQEERMKEILEEQKSLELLEFINQILIERVCDSTRSDTALLDDIENKLISISESKEKQK